MPKKGDLLRSLKQWYWKRYYEPTNSHDFMDAGFIYTPYVPLVITPVPVVGARVKFTKQYIKKIVNPSYFSTLMINNEMPVDKALLVLSCAGTTIMFFYDDLKYTVTAAREEHILNDFELLSSVDVT